MEIDWTKESPKVKEACDHIVAAHGIHKSMTDEEKKRFDELMEALLPQEEE